MTSTHPIDLMTPDVPAMASVDIALVLQPGALRDAILYALRELKTNVVHDHADPSNWSGLAAAIEQSGVQVLLFDLLSLEETALAKSIGEIRTRMPHLKIIAAYPYDDPA